MKNALKGALLSGLLFPGMGQLALKHYTRGAVIMLTVTASMAVIVTKAVQNALAILEKIDLSGGPVDINAITSAATRATSNSGSLILNLCTFLTVFGWLIGVVDAYRIGKKMDTAQGLPNHAPTTRKR